MFRFLVIGGAILFLVLTFGGRFLRLPTWRIGSAMGSLFAFAGAGYFMVREIWPVAIVLAVLGVWMAVSARFPRASPRAAPRPRRPDPPAPRGAMPLTQARSILGVEESASRAEIQAAYTRLMKRAHPDKGGSEGLAAQLNAARDRLLKG